MTREINDFGWKTKAATDNKIERKDIHMSTTRGMSTRKGD